MDYIKSLTLRPNPTSNDVWVDLEMNEVSDVQLSIFDSMGRLVYNSNMKSVETIRERIDLANFTDGVYIVQVRSETSSRQAKLIVNK